ncbi:squalene/phytoene synthase family protein [Tropicimonas sediminicola]|uniref:Squalene/phytoene synthase n=1 Tax=Tropicimonas sediminicola TaxID=1031541 RepID=A0A239GYN8_9RHOB|nr:squalene/phytoene synthase family protein [Tropicimonas sediminicola]SNS74319.1 Squalene/phytoene synthase [Tropicimonas sediminicola]
MSLDACAVIVARGDPDRFLATMAAPVAARELLLPLYAFNVEVARLPWVSPEPMICEMRLQWWRDLLTRIAAGTVPDTHEIAAPLAGVIGHNGAVAEVLDRLIVARQWDIYRDPFEDDAALHAYIDATAAGLTWAAANVLGAPEASEPAIRDAGWAAGLANYLRAVPELETHGRRPLVDGRPAAVSALAQAGLDRLARARKATIPAEAYPALLAGWRAKATLERAAKEPARVADGALHESEFARRGGLFLRSLRGTW